MKFNISDTHISWEGYLQVIGSNIYLMAYKKKTDIPKLSVVKNAIFTFDLTQIQVVSFQCNQFLI